MNLEGWYISNNTNKSPNTQFHSDIIIQTNFFDFGLLETNTLPGFFIFNSYRAIKASNIQATYWRLVPRQYCSWWPQCFQYPQELCLKTEQNFLNIIKSPGKQEWQAIGLKTTRL